MVFLGRRKKNRQMLFPVLEHAPDGLDLGALITGNKEEKKGSAISLVCTR
jgi:hypothetical protein